MKFVLKFDVLFEYVKLMLSEMLMMKSYAQNMLMLKLYIFHQKWLLLLLLMMNLM